MKKIINLLLVSITLAYPFLWYCYQQTNTFRWIAILMATVWMLRAILQNHIVQKIISISISVFFLLIILLKTSQAMYWYPIGVNVLMLMMFSASLLSPQSFIERIARLQHPDLDLQGVIYTRKVTILWCLFFILNIFIILALIYFMAWYWWTLYTGIISYLLMGILLLSEYLYRKIILKKSP